MIKSLKTLRPVTKVLALVAFVAVAAALVAQIEASREGGVGGCPSGEVPRALNNYPGPDFVKANAKPTANESHHDYYTKHSSGNWRCQKVCVPLRANMRDYLRGATVDGRDLFIVQAAPRAANQTLKARAPGFQDVFNDNPVAAMTKTVIVATSFKQQCEGPNNTAYGSLVIPAASPQGNGEAVVPGGATTTCKYNAEVYGDGEPGKYATWVTLHERESDREVAGSKYKPNHTGTFTKTVQIPTTNLDKTSYHLKAVPIDDRISEGRSSPFKFLNVGGECLSQPRGITINVTRLAVAGATAQGAVAGVNCVDMMDGYITALDNKLITTCFNEGEANTVLKLEKIAEVADKIGDFVGGDDVVDAYIAVDGVTIRVVGRVKDILWLEEAVKLAGKVDDSGADRPAADIQHPVVPVLMVPDKAAENEAREDFPRGTNKIILRPARFTLDYPSGKKWAPVGAVEYTVRVKTTVASGEDAATDQEGAGTVQLSGSPSINDVQMANQRYKVTFFDREGTVVAIAEDLDKSALRLVVDRVIAAGGRAYRAVGSLFSPADRKERTYEFISKVIDNGSDTEVVLDNMPYGDYEITLRRAGFTNVGPIKLKIPESTRNGTFEFGTRGDGEGAVIALKPQSKGVEPPSLPGARQEVVSKAGKGDYRSWHTASAGNKRYVYFDSAPWYGWQAENLAHSYYLKPPRHGENSAVPILDEGNKISLLRSPFTFAPVTPSAPPATTGATGADGAGSGTEGGAPVQLPELTSQTASALCKKNERMDGYISALDGRQIVVCYNTKEAEAALELEDIARKALKTGGFIGETDIIIDGFVTIRGKNLQLVGTPKDILWLEEAVNKSLKIQPK